MKNIARIFTIALLLAFGTASVMAQDTTKKVTRKAPKKMKSEQVADLLKSKHFTFKALYANPIGGGMMTLNGRLIDITPNGGGRVYLNYDYDLRIRHDSVIAYLPYYGRTTFAPSYNPSSTENGVMFTSTKFGYQSETSKKGNTTITITPEDAKYNQKLILNITSSGSAYLQVIILNRTPISYDGYIVKE